MTATIENHIIERINAMENRRTILREQIANPPPKITPAYLVDRIMEVRTLTLMIDAVMNTVKGASASV